MTSNRKTVAPTQLLQGTDEATHARSLMAEIYERVVLNLPATFHLVTL